MQTKQPIDPDKIEYRPDGEERFRAAVHAAAKSGPMHREPKAKSVVVKKARKD
jgi:hypothetical protein